MIAGIDNGVSGAVCLIDPDSGALIDYRVMPIRKLPKANKRAKQMTEVDAAALRQWLPESVSLIVVEEPLSHAPSSQSMRSMALSFGKIMGLCESHGIPHQRVRVVDWQKHFFGLRFAKGASKTLAARVAARILPDQSWIPDRCRTPHDGVIDAFLIARYVWEKKSS